MKCEASTHRRAPTSSAISRNAAKSIVARVRGVAGQDDLRALRLGEVADAVHVELLGLAVDLVADEVEPHAADVHRRAVREVAAVGEHHARGPCRRSRRLEERAEHRHVRLGAGVGLHVRVLGAEQLLRPVDRELLGDVDELAPAVVAPAGVALGVLVRSSSTRAPRARPGSRSSPRRSAAGSSVRARARWRSPRRPPGRWPSGPPSRRRTPCRHLTRSPRSISAICSSRGTCRPPSNGVASQTRTISRA